MDLSEINATIMKRFNKTITDFFNEEKYWVKVNRDYQEKLFTMIKALDTNFNVFSDSRNYEHCITFAIDYDSSGVSHDTFNNSLIEEHQYDESDGTVSIYRLAIYVSDMLPLINFSWSQIQLSDKKSIRNVLENLLPEPIRSKLQNLEKIILNEKTFEIVGGKQLNEKATWFKHSNLDPESSYQPTYFELLFGGLDLYNELGI